MKTRSGWSHLRRLFLFSGGCALGAFMCTSVIAGPNLYREATSRPHMAQDMSAQRVIKVYLMTSASAIPKPINYVIGGVITTPTPIEIVGREVTVNR
jgi:hypothetical protein